MKVLIVALNSKYTHTSLAVRCLYNAVKDLCDVSFSEYTINDNPDSVAADIFMHKPDCVAFSCYIWNIEVVRKISSVIKKASPRTLVVFGGHEVEYDAHNILENNMQADAVLRGEGEISLREYIECVLGKKEFSDACSFTYRQNKEIIFLPDTKECVDLNKMDFPYDDSIVNLNSRIIYYETSRGCPYNCTYCLSGAGNRVRFLDVERVKKELLFFMEKKVPLVKLVDRTFNADKKRAREIFDFIAKNPSDTCFHMELSGDLLDDETLEILSKVKKGTLQFEIGVQTTNSKTMEAIDRKVSFEKLKYAVGKLMENGNIHIHLDLIAGLPHEDMASFKNSFNEVLSLKPHVLQLGFLKMLKGSRIRNSGDKYGYVYREYPPYEVIGNQFIDYEDILELKIVEDALEKFYNSGNFKHSLSFLMSVESNYYEIFRNIGNYIKSKFPTGYAFSKQALYDIIYESYKEQSTEFADALKMDYLKSFRPGVRPAWMGEYDSSYTSIAYEMFKDEELKSKFYPHYYNIPAKEIMKHIYADKIGDLVLLFDHKYDRVYNITEFCSNM